MNVAESIQVLLEDAGVSSVIGDLPSLTVNCICIQLFDGITNTEYFGGKSGSTIYRPVVKITVRNTSYEQGKVYVDTIRNTLHRHTDRNLLSILLVGSPMYLGKDAQRIHEFQITFSIQGVD